MGFGILGVFIQLEIAKPKITNARKKQKPCRGARAVEREEERYAAVIVL